MQGLQDRKGIMEDKIIRATAASGLIRAISAQTTNMVARAQQIHYLEPSASAALGRTMTAVAMMSMDLKNEGHTISAIIHGNGSIGSVIVVGSQNGRVKGYVGNPKAETNITPEGKIDVAHAIGTEASLTIIKDFGLKKPYSGQVPMASREIAEDFAYYFAVSEQKPSAVGLGVLVETDNHVRAAGGFIIQTMPNVTEEIIQKLESRIATMTPISKQIDEGKDCIQLLESILGDMDLKINDETTPVFECNCSRDRLRDVIATIDQDELKTIIEEDHGIEITCHYCNQTYRFNEAECIEMLSR
jgi:molecular chaperone Hsp33